MTKDTQEEEVYNMVVADNHNFSIYGGLITHNCDSMRYFVKTNNLAKPRNTYTGGYY